MNRRRFLGVSALAAVGIATGAVVFRRATMTPPSLGALMTELEALRDKTVIASGLWSPFKVFSHLAQSVDYSMTGYPELESPVFRKTIGPAAFFAFETVGAMSHDLAAPIPGAPGLPDEGSTAEAVDRLLDSLRRFEAFTGALQPHFAYGALDHARYTAAHVLHVRNHFDELTVT